MSSGKPGKGVVRLGQRHIDAVAQSLYDIGYEHVIIAVRKGHGHDDRYKTFHAYKGDPLTQQGMLETVECEIEWRLADEEGVEIEDESDSDPDCEDD